MNETELFMGQGGVVPIGMTLHQLTQRVLFDDFKTLKNQ